MYVNKYLNIFLYTHLFNFKMMTIIEGVVLDRIYFTLVMSSMFPFDFLLKN